MNLGLVPLLIVALLMSAADGEVDTVRLLLSGVHDLDDQAGAVVVADSTARVTPDAEVPGPVYVIGGELAVSGRVAGDVVQLAGSVRLDDTATVDGELRHVGGTLVVSPGATVGRRTSLSATSATGRGPSELLVSTLAALVLALIAARLSRTRRAALDNVAAAAGDHPVVTLTVGILVALTAVAVFAFMAVTLLLVPVALIGLAIGVVATAYGVIALGHLLAVRLPVRDPRMASALGVVVVVVTLQLVALVPLVGDLAALAALLTGLGAVLVTYFGVARLRLDVLPE